MRNLLVFVLFVVIIIIALGFCRAIPARLETMQVATVPVQTPFPTIAPLPTVAPTLSSAAPARNLELPVENSEWYIDGWAEDSIVVNLYGREMRFDLAELRNSQTNAAIIVQCIDPEAKRPDLDFTLPVAQRDRFIYKGNQFWHVTDPSVQRFIFLRHGELQ